MPESTKEQPLEIAVVGEHSRLSHNYIEMHERASTLVEEIMRPYWETHRTLHAIAAQAMEPYWEMQRNLSAITARLMEPYFELQRSFADAAEAIREFTETQRGKLGRRAI